MAKQEVWTCLGQSTHEVRKSTNPGNMCPLSPGPLGPGSIPSIRRDCHALAAKCVALIGMVLRLPGLSQPARMPRILIGGHLPTSRVVFSTPPAPDIPFRKLGSSRVLQRNHPDIANELKEPLVCSSFSGKPRATPRGAALLIPEDLFELRMFLGAPAAGTHGLPHGLRIIGLSLPTFHLLT